MLLNKEKGLLNTAVILYIEYSIQVIDIYK